MLINFFNCRYLKNNFDFHHVTESWKHIWKVLLINIISKACLQRGRHVTDVTRSTTGAICSLTVNSGMKLIFSHKASLTQQGPLALNILSPSLTLNLRISLS